MLNDLHRFNFEYCVFCFFEEMNCPSTNCPENMFECGSHECIDNLYFCDGSSGNNYGFIFAFMKSFFE